MAPLVPTCAPASFIAGDTVKWTRALGDYPVADGWTAHLALRGAKTIDVDATTAGDGTSHLIALSAGDSAKLEAGQYQWSLWVELDGEIYTVERGVVVVDANPDAQQDGDAREPEEIEIALINTQIQELLASSNESYSIGQRSAQKRKLDDLYKARGIASARLGRKRGQDLPSYALGFNAPS